MLARFCLSLFALILAAFLPIGAFAQEQLAPDEAVVTVIDIGDDLTEVETPQPPPPLPEAVMEVLKTALTARDTEAVRSIARIARLRYPDGADEVDALIADFENEQRQFALFNAVRDAPPLTVAVRRIEPATLGPINPRFWKGKLELGGFRSTGSTDEIGISFGLTGSYSIGRWEHKLRGRVDYREANGRTSREHMLAAYEPRLRFSPEMFVYGLTQYERAPFIGYDNRYTSSAGIGYTIHDHKGLRIAIDSGPAYRLVDYVQGTRESRLGLRSSLDLDWRISPTITFGHNAYTYIEENVGTVTLNNVLDTRVMPRLSARFSYDVQYETNKNLNGNAKRERLDTMSRVSIVYDF